MLASQCSRREGQDPETPAHADGKVVDFAFPRADTGVLVSASSLRGRCTVVTVITTYDLASQAQARFLESVRKTHTPRINALAISVDPKENSLLVASFAGLLHLSYPLLVSDLPTLRELHTFGELRVVPTTLVLDESGMLVWKREGLAKAEEIDEALGLR